MITEVYNNEVHYFRNKLNRAPATRDELISEEENWKLLEVKDSIYHMNGEDGLYNTKFISVGDGRFEGVYNKDGELLTEENDPINMGTYNYCSASKNKALHGFYDVFPYYIYGNTENYKHASSIDPEDFYNDIEAQKAYNEIKNQMNMEN